MTTTAQKIALPLLLSLTMGSAYAAVNGCDIKRANIEREIADAQEHNNGYKVAGLEKALNDVNRYCTHEGLVNKAKKNIAATEKKIKKKQQELEKLLSDLNQAKAKGKKDKIKKYQEKIADKQADIRELEQQLQQEKAELAALND